MWSFSGHGGSKLPLCQFRTKNLNLSYGIIVLIILKLYEIFWVNFLLFLVIWKYCGKLQLKKSKYNAISAREGGVPMFWFIWLSCVSKSIKGCSRNWILGKYEFHENSTMYSSYFWTIFLQQPKFDKSLK